MNFEFDIRWKFRDRTLEEIDPRFFDLLRYIRDQGSLRSAAREVALSYRHAWGLIKFWTERLNHPVVVFEKGRGAHLTELGEKILWAEHFIDSRLETHLESITEDINTDLLGLIDTGSNSGKLRIYASNGLAINHLKTLLEKSGKFDIDFQSRGSLDSLREFSNNHCDIAGFHFPSGDTATCLAPVYLQWLDSKSHQFIHVAMRQQGLMVQSRNRQRITGINSLVKRSVRFINRQKESGTRVIFDELLRLNNIKPGQINGYLDEEFTHIAVAAVVASGTVDAGFGIQAAASRFGLEFIPMVSEQYILALPGKLPQRFLREIKTTLKSGKFRNQVNRLPGYDARLGGNTMSLNEIFSSGKA